MFRIKEDQVVKTQTDVVQEFCETIGKAKAIKLAQSTEMVHNLLDATLVGMALSRKEMTAEELYKQTLTLLGGVNKLIK